MKRILVTTVILSFVVMGMVCGCATSGSATKDLDAIVDASEAFTPIRTKYKVVRPGEIPQEVEALRIAVVDVRLENGMMQFGFLPALYRTRTGYCQILKEKVVVASLDGLIKAIDRYVDRMPFAVLFTYNGRATSDPEVVEKLPVAYGDFYQMFQQKMQNEDIEYVCLLPDHVSFLK